MRFFIYLLFIVVCSTTVCAQSEMLAKNYFEQGQFEKALPIYKDLHEKNPSRRDYFLALVATYQQLEQFENAQQLLEHEIETTRNDSTLFIELGRNYNYLNDTETAELYYQKAIEAIDTEPRWAYSIANAFERHALLDKAVIAYKKGMELNPSANYHSQLARLYGEQGQLENMFESFLKILEVNSKYLPIVIRNFGLYITENPDNEANELLRKALLKRSQSNPDIMYNDLLTWLFIQQKEYGKAFVQQKAIYRRTKENMDEILDLAQTTIQSNAYDTANEILQFAIENAPRESQLLQAHRYKMHIAVTTAKKEDYGTVSQQFEALISEFGNDELTFDLQLDYAAFLAFKAGDIPSAIAYLNEMKEREWSRYREATLLMNLADVLIFDEKFNQALIYYSQVQHKVKNDPLAQEARYKIARASYYKGDFTWAVTQLEVLKKSTSQLIANDAMELNLLISDNSIEDSTQTALKKYAKADLLVLQEKYEQANTILEGILSEHSEESIIDEALYKQAEIFEKQHDYQKAVNNYLKIADVYQDDILADNAHFRLGEIYRVHLNLPEEAKTHYEAIIFNHADSIFFTEARKQYRKLRGDVIQ